MIIGREEALPILRKWSEESSDLVCEADLRSIAFFVEGKMADLSESLIAVRSDDGRSEIRFSLDAVVAFDFNDTRRMPEASKEFDFGVTFFFDVTDDPERIAIVERRHSRPA
ncbi:MAG TPA: hypothetical protein VIY49_37120 [Bryobacteraceae bacterium]